MLNPEVARRQELIRGLQLEILEFQKLCLHNWIVLDTWNDSIGEYDRNFRFYENRQCLKCGKIETFSE